MQAHWYAHAASPVGELLLVAGDDGLCGLYMEGQRHAADVASGWREDPGPFREVSAQLEEYFAGARRGFDLKLVLAGTPFQRAVWGALNDIPYGETVSYRDVARRVGRPDAMRAVGLANGRNPVCIVLPCHRVVGADGSLTGYGGGVDRKRWLLEHEARTVGLSRSGDTEPAMGP